MVRCSAIGHRGSLQDLRRELPGEGPVESHRAGGAGDCRPRARRMTDRPAASDALVLFGLTGDLAHKMIFPALYAMVQRGVLTVPVVGVASRSWSVAQLRARVVDSVTQSGAQVEERALSRLLSLLQYVSGDYNNPETYAALKNALGKSRRPAHYLAIPPALFETVIQGIGAAGLADHARVIVEKPFGRDLASARELNAVARAVFPEDGVEFARGGEIATERLFDDDPRVVRSEEHT